MTDAIVWQLKQLNNEAGELSKQVEKVESDVAADPGNPHLQQKYARLVAEKKDLDVRRKALEDRLLPQDKLVDYHHTSTTMIRGTISDGLAARKVLYYSKRQQTVVQILEMLLASGAVLLRGPPYSGKTSIEQLITATVENNITANTGEWAAAYHISLAQMANLGLDQAAKTFDDIWRAKYQFDFKYLTSSSPPPSPSGDSSTPALPLHLTDPNNKGLILLTVDEGHLGFGHPLLLWAVLKDLCSGQAGERLRLIVTSAWGSSSSLTEPPGGATAQCTPPEFTLDNTVSLRSTPGLRMTLDEARELWDMWCAHGGFTANASLTVRDFVLDVCDRQPGMLVTVLDWLATLDLKSDTSQQDWERRAVSALMSRALPDAIASIRSIVRYEKFLELDKPECVAATELLRRLLSYPEVDYQSLPSAVQAVAIAMVRQGQVIEHYPGYLSLPSKLHKIHYSRRHFRDSCLQAAQLQRMGLLEFLKMSVERMSAATLRSSFGRRQPGDSPYEAHTSDELYRAMSSLLPPDIYLSTSVGMLFGARGYLDHCISAPINWGIEVVREGDDILGHVTRFDLDDGKYRALLDQGIVREYAVVDFRTKSVKKIFPSPELVHVLFVSDYREAHFIQGGVVQAVVTLQDVAVQPVLAG